jgi:hypothetical protein
VVAEECGCTGSGARSGDDGVEGHDVSFYFIFFSRYWSYSISDSVMSVKIG